MAKRRMFSKDVIETDNFMEMPETTQNLYFHLALRADDDGFVSSPKQIVKLVGKEDDLKVLIGKKYIIPFESGVIVIRHWKVHNYIQNDRYTETQHLAEKRLINQSENGEYEIMDTECIQSVSTGKDRIGKDRLGKERDTYTEKNPFSLFGNLYPKGHREQKARCEKLGEKLSKEEQEAILRDIPQRLAGEKGSKQDGKYIEMSSTYLHNRNGESDIKMAEVYDFTNVG